MGQLPRAYASTCLLLTYVMRKRKSTAISFIFTNFINLLYVATDPEEMKQAQEEMRNQGVPSLASLLPGGGRN